MLEGQAYVVSGYLAVLAALLILAGALSDHYGRKRVYAIGLAGFAITSALCGLSPSLEWLILFRLVQGGAGALLVPGALSLITQTFQGAERARAFGVWAASTSALTVLGPIVGGLIVDTIGWRFAFLINVPAAGGWPCGSPSVTWPNRATTRHPGGSTGWARGSRHWPSADWPSG